MRVWWKFGSSSFTVVFSFQKSLPPFANSWLRAWRGAGPFTSFEWLQKRVKCDLNGVKKAISFSKNHKNRLAETTVYDAFELHQLVQLHRRSQGRGDAIPIEMPPMTKIMTTRPIVSSSFCVFVYISKPVIYKNINNFDQGAPAYSIQFFAN